MTCTGSKERCLDARPCTSGLISPIAASESAHRRATQGPGQAERRSSARPVGNKLRDRRPCVRRPRGPPPASHGVLEPQCCCRVWLPCLTAWPPVPRARCARPGHSRAGLQDRDCVLPLGRSRCQPSGYCQRALSGAGVPILGAPRGVALDGRRALLLREAGGQAWKPDPTAAALTGGDWPSTAPGPLNLMPAVRALGGPYASYSGFLDACGARPTGRAPLG